jgi:hypothetical protein
VLRLLLLAAGAAGCEHPAVALFRPNENSQALIRTIRNRTAGGIDEMLRARERSNVRGWGAAVLPKHFVVQMQPEVA